MKYIITIIFIILEIALFAFNIGGIGISAESTSVYKSIGMCLAVINVFISCLMLGISIDAMKKIKNKHKAMAGQVAYLIGLGIIWAGNLAIISTCTDYVDGNIDVIIGATFMILVGLAIVIPIFVFNRKKASKTKQNEINFRSQKGEDIAKYLMEKSYFTYDNAEWYYDEAFKEYCMIHGLSSVEDLEQHMPRLIGIGDLTEEEKDKLWDYAGLHMGYLLTWLASRKLLSDKLTETLGDPLEDIELREHSNNGLELLSQMDYKICSQDIGAGEVKEAFEYKPEYRRTYEMDKKDGFIHKFLGCYINGLAPLDAYFYKDIPGIIMKDGVQYCQDFSWNTYDKIAVLLNQKYDYFAYCEEQAHIEENFIYPETESETSNMSIYTIENERWWLDFQVYTRPDVKQDYKDRVIQSITDMSLTLQREIARKILEVYYDDYARDFICSMPSGMKLKRTADHIPTSNNEEFIGDVMDRISRNPEELFMYDELFSCLELHIFAPRDENIIAYVITFESLLEEEHGISVSVFDSHVLEVGYHVDYENPWVTNRNFVISENSI